MVIDDILNKKAELVITKPEESAVMRLPRNYLEAPGPLVGQKQPIKDTVEYIAALSKTVKSTGLEIVQAKAERYGGTWGHPQADRVLRPQGVDEKGLNSIKTLGGS